MLIPRTPKEIWLNRVRVWLPPAFVVCAVVLKRPMWHWWGAPLVLVGESLRTWAAGHLLKDEQLTVGGPYAYTRNPLYLGSMISGVGFLALLGDWLLAGVFAVIALAVYVPSVRQEEHYLKRMHAQAFDAYCRAVPALVPRLLPAKVDAAGVRQSRFEWDRVWLNKEHRTWAALAALVGILLLRTWGP